MELELIEPFLFLGESPPAAARLAEALLGRTPGERYNRPLVSEPEERP